MAKCTECGSKIGWREERHYSNNGIRCQSCYDKHRIHQDELERIRVERKKRKKEEGRKKKLEKKKKELERWKKMTLGELIGKLGSPIDIDRINSAKHLGRLKNRKAVRPLIEALKDKNYHVRKEAIKSLGKIGNPSALDNLRKIYNKSLVGISYSNELDKSIKKLKRIKFERMAMVAESDLKEMAWENFEDTVIESLDAIPSDTRTGDMGIDGITKNGVPIQIKQSERIGRNVVDNFQTALRRYYPSNKKNLKGIIVAFSFTTGAYSEVERAKREDKIDIKLITADELVS